MKKTTTLLVNAKLPKLNPKLLDGADMAARTTPNQTSAGHCVHISLSESIVPGSVSRSD